MSAPCMKGMVDVKLIGFLDAKSSIYLRGLLLGIMHMTHKADLDEYGWMKEKEKALSELHVWPPMKVTCCIISRVEGASLDCMCNG